MVLFRLVDDSQNAKGVHRSIGKRPQDRLSHRQSQERGAYLREDRNEPFDGSACWGKTIVTLWRSPVLSSS